MIAVSEWKTDFRHARKAPGNAGKRVRSVKGEPSMKTMKTMNIKTVLTGIVTAVTLSSTTAYTLLPLTVQAASSSASTASSAASGQNSQPQGNPPDGGNGQAPSGNPPAKPDGSAPSGNAGGGTAPSGSAPGGGQSAVTSWDAATEFTADATEDDGIYDSTGTDENAVHVSNGASVTLNSPDGHEDQFGQPGRRQFQLLRRRCGSAYDRWHDLCQRRYGHDRFQRRGRHFLL
jgi:hypothetical protein